MNFKIKKEKTIKANDDLNNVFFIMIITDRTIKYLQTKSMKKQSCKSKDEERIKKRQLLNEQLDRVQINNDITNEEFKQYQMKRLNNINKLNEIDNNYRLTITRNKIV